MKRVIYSSRKETLFHIYVFCFPSVARMCLNYQRLKNFYFVCEMNLFIYFFMGGGGGGGWGNYLSKPCNKTKIEIKIEF